MNPIFKGIIKQGQFVPDLAAKFKTYLYAREGRRVECVIRPESKFRSDKELNYYWAVIVPIICETSGYDPNSEIEKDMVHEFIKKKFYPKISVFDESIPMRSKNMSTIQIEAMYSSIREWASTFLGCYIPLPNEVDY